ncbi:ribonuclease H-like domain-containing protein [Tanacetum coccineum]
MEETSSKAILAIDGAGFDWIYMADDKVPINMALMAFSDSEFNKFEFNLATYKRGLASVEEQLVFYKKNGVIFYEQIAVLKRDISYKDSKINMLKSELEKINQEKERIQLKIEKFDNASKSLDKLIGSQITNNSRKGVGFVSYNAVPPPPTGLFSPPTLDLSNSGLVEFQQPEFEGYGPKTSKSVSEDISNEVRESHAAPLVKELVSKDKLEKKTVFPTKIEFVRPKQKEKPVRKPVKYAEMYRSQGPRRNQRNWNNQKSQQLGSDFVMYNKACFVCGSFDHVQANCNYHQRERVVSRNNYIIVNYNYFAKQANPSAHRNMAPRAVLMKTGLRPLNNDRPVNTAHHKTTVHSVRPIQKVNTARPKAVNTTRPKADNTARPNSAVVNAVRVNQVNAVKASACWVWRPTKLNSASITFKIHNYVDARGRSKEHVISLRFYGYVTFGGGANGGKITGKGTLKTGKLDFEDVYFVKELKFNLFSVLQMCDKKNSVLFTDTGCFVLSPDFKLADESQVLLKVPRKNNMYSVDMKNIVPKESLTCLVAKAILDESMLWHRRLGIRREFSVARTPQQNGIAERRNRTLIEAARTMLADFKLPTTFWAEVVNTACYVQNRVLVVKPHNKTPYELFRGRTPALSFMRPFGCYVTILNTLDHLGKFDGKSDEEFFVGYSLNSKAFRVYNIRTRKLEENLHIRFLKDKPIIAGDGPMWLFDIDVLTKSMNYVPVVTGTNSNDSVGVSKESGIDDQEKPKDSAQDVNTAGPSINTASINFNTELDMSNINTTYPVPSTPNTRIHKDHSLDHVIGDMQAGGYTQEEGIDYDEVSAPVAGIEAIRLFLAYASFRDFVVYQMDVKSAFLYGKIEEEVYVCQPPGFEDPEFPNKIYKVEKALYGLHQAPKACQDKYVDEILKKFGFSTVKTASTPMETSKPLLKDAETEDVDVHLYRSMIGSLMYLTSSRPDIMFVVCACARFQVTPKVSHLHAVKRIFRYLKGQPKLGLWYPKDSPFDLEAYSNSDYAGASLDRKSTTGGCQFLGSRLISWQCKKQTTVANSTTKVEYVAATSCCGQVLWIQNQMLDYRYNFMNTKIFIDNESTICIVKNPVFHSKTKHIEIRHHFIRDSNEKKLIQMIKIHTDQNVADLLTKAFDVGRFQYLIASIGMLNL